MYSRVIAAGADPNPSPAHFTPRTPARRRAQSSRRLESGRLQTLPEIGLLRLRRGTAPTTGHTGGLLGLLRRRTSEVHVHVARRRPRIGRRPSPARSRSETGPGGDDVLQRGGKHGLPPRSHFSLVLATWIRKSISTWIRKSISLPRAACPTVLLQRPQQAAHGSARNRLRRGTAPTTGHTGGLLGLLRRRTSAVHVHVARPRPRIGRRRSSHGPSQQQAHGRAWGVE